MALSPDGKIVATGFNNGTIKLWDLDGKLLKTLKGHTDWISSISFSPDGTMIATGQGTQQLASDRWVKLWRTDGKLLWSMPGTDMIFSPDSKSVAYIREGKSGTLETIKGKTLANLGNTSLIAISPDGKTIATAHSVCNDKCRVQSVLFE